MDDFEVAHMGYDGKCSRFFKQPCIDEAFLGCSWRFDCECSTGKKKSLSYIDTHVCLVMTNRVNVLLNTELSSMVSHTLKVEASLNEKKMEIGEESIGRSIPR